MSFWPLNFEELSSEEKLLFGAYRSLLEKGYQGTTSRSIAEFAGVNQGLIHHYYGSQENLFARMIFRLHAEAHRIVAEASTRREMLEFFCQAGASAGTMEADICSLGREMPRVKDAMMQTMACKRRDISEVFGFQRPEDITLFLGALRGIQIELALNPDLDQRACLDRLADLLLGGSQVLDEPLEWDPSERLAAASTR
ncbi:MAG: helix-turn-helix domain-containing protein [Leptospiraceae bacterium]